MGLRAKNFQEKCEHGLRVKYGLAENLWKSFTEIVGFHPVRHHRNAGHLVSGITDPINPLLAFLIAVITVCTLNVLDGYPVNDLNFSYTPDT